MELKVKEFKLESIAKQGGEVTELLNSFGTQKESEHIFIEAQKVILDLLVLSEGVKRDDKQNSSEFLERGIKKMFSIMAENKGMTAAPKSEGERYDFYKKLAHGYKFVGDTI